MRGEVAAEIVQHGGLALAVALFLGRAAIAGAAAVVIIVVGALWALGLGGGSRGGGRWAIAGQDGLHLMLHAIVVHVELAQGTGGQVVRVLQHAQQHVFGIDLWALEKFGFQEGDLQHFFGLLHQGDLVLLRRAHAAGRLHAPLHHFAQVLEVHLHVAEYLDGVALALADQAQEDVLNADAGMAQAQGLLAAESDDFPYPG
jgi:hypothetical protein